MEKKKKAQTQAAVKTHRHYSSFESEVSLERSSVQFSPSLENFPKRCNCPLTHVEHQELTDETLGNMYYSFDALNSCVVCALFFSVQAFLLLHINLALKIISTIFFFLLVQLFILFLWFPIFCAFCCCCITSSFNTGMHFYINCSFLLFCGGCSDLLVRFAFFILQQALCSGGVFCIEIYLINSLYESVISSVVFIACGTFYLFISLLSILLF